jgi:hypothetical protein
LANQKAAFANRKIALPTSLLIKAENTVQPCRGRVAEEGEMKDLKKRLAGKLAGTPPLESFSEANRFYVELLRSPDEESRECALSEIAGNLDDELAGEIRRQIAAPGDVDWRLRLFEQLEIELDSGLYCHLEEEEEAEGGGLCRRTIAELQVFLCRFYLDERENPRLRRKALEVSALLPLPWHEEAVRECWSRPEPEWRLSALIAMGHLFPIDFAGEIGEALASVDEALRAQAIVAADQRDLYDLGPQILRIAADRGGELEERICAIEALPNLRPPGSRALLEKLRAEAAPVGPFAADALHNLIENERAVAHLAAAAAGPSGFLRRTGGASQFL